jgi:hypothetical protein
VLVPAGSHAPDEDAAALRIVLYFDVFDHPLSEAELAEWLGAGGPSRVEALIAGGRLVSRDGRLCLPGREALAARRRERAVAAERLWPTARRSAALLARFPWIRGILVTGGLSKNSVGPDADVDFLLLVDPGRVWLAKSALEVVRRALPRAGREALCTNYLLSTDSLAIPEVDRDIYAATEIVTARPLYGPAACSALFAANPWVRRWFPGFRGDDAVRAAPLGPAPARSPRLDGLDGLARRAWDRYWTHKYRHLDPGVISRGFRREPHVCANHLDDWRAPVLARWRERLAAHGVGE